MRKELRKDVKDMSLEPLGNAVFISQRRDSQASTASCDDHSLSLTELFLPSRVISRPRPSLR